MLKGLLIVLGVWVGLLVSGICLVILWAQALKLYGLLKKYRLDQVFWSLVALSCVVGFSYLPRHIENSICFVCGRIVVWGTLFIAALSPLITIGDWWQRNDKRVPAPPSDVEW